MSQKLLTVTVPCYNSQDYMRGCVDSLLAGGERVEIIIIDDGSTDATGAIADEYASVYPTIVKVVHQENGGHGEGINQGAKHATGIYFKVPFPYPTGGLPRYCPVLHGFHLRQRSVLSKHFHRKQNGVQAAP